MRQVKWFNICAIGISESKEKEHDIPRSNFKIVQIWFFKKL
jgi:hypothetical protein